MNESLSVIMPCKNVEAYVEKAILSIMNQTHKDFEFIIINDGSVDKTQQILEKYEAMDHRIKLILNDTSLGLVECINIGIKNSRCDWIARMDGDDISLPDRLEKQMEFIKENPNVKVLGCFAYYIDYNDKIIGKMHLNTTNIDEYWRKIRKGKLIFVPGGASILHKKTILDLGGVNKDFEFIEDLELNMRVALHGYVVMNLPQYLYMYRKGNITNTANVFLLNKKMRWLKERMKCSRQGMRQPTYEEFVKSEDDESIIPKLKHIREDYASYYFKQFGFSLIRKNYCLSVCLLMLSFILNPVYVLFKLEPRVKDVLMPNKAKHNR